MDERQCEYLKKKLDSKDLVVRYIKLGEGGKHAEECFKQGKIIFSYDLNVQEVQDALKLKDKEDKLIALKNYWKKKKDENGDSLKTSTASLYANQTLAVTNGDINTLWITFEVDTMYYCFADSSEIYCETSPSYIRTNDYGWMKVDLNCELLKIDRLPGSLVKTRGTQHTTCNINKAEYARLIRKILGRPNEVLESAKEARKLNNKEALRGHIESLVKNDFQADMFELLVELIFSETEKDWIRTSLTGGNQKIIDFSLFNFKTNKSAFVQVKTNAKQKGDKKDPHGFNDYLEQLNKSSYSKMFFVYHKTTNDKELSFEKPCEKEVSIWHPNDVIDKVMSSERLVDWVLHIAHKY